MFTKILIAPLVAAALLIASPAWAQGCASPAEVTTLMVAEIQQRLMVAAYTCHYVEYYNRLVLTHRSELRKSDKRMLHLFVSHDGSAGDDEYNAFKTRLANLSSRESNDYPGTFCYRAQELFTAVLYNRRSLASLAASERPYSALPFDACGR
jgi:hypothetical protein